MNSNRIHKVRTATVIAFIACASTASPAFAGEAHGDGEGGAVTNNVSPYAMPTTALDGMTLAQYLQQHQAGDHRTITVV